MPIATAPSSSSSPKMERLTPKQEEDDESGNNSDESTMAVDPVNKNKNKNGGGLMRSMFGGGKKSNKEKEDQKKHHHHHKKESKSSNNHNKKESKRSTHKNHHNHHHTSKTNAKMPTRVTSVCEETEEDTTPAPTTKDVSPIANTRIPRRGGSGILKEPSASLSQTARMATQQLKTVSFSNVYLREYARTVGDNPSVSSGPPIGISWDYLPTQTTSLESFEAKRCKNRKSRPEDLIVPRQVRVHLLKQVWGVSQNELAQAVRAVLKIKHARRTTIQNQGKSTEQVEEALESGFSMFKKALTPNKQQNKQKVLELQAQQKQAQTARQQERLQALQQLSSRQDQVQASSSGRGARPKRRLSVPQASPEDLFGEDDNDDDLEMLQQDKEFGRVPPSCVVPRPDLVPSSSSPGHRTRQPNRSILKTSQHQTNNNDIDYGYNDDSQQKSVSFAVNSETNKVWCLVKEFPAAPVKYHDDLWWPEHDLDDRYEQDMEIVQLLQHQYGNLLRNAYKSTKRRGNTNTNAPPVVLDIDKLEHCSIARGLEAEVMPELRDICKTHQKAVLYKQEQVRGDSKFVAMMDDDDLERIRVGSCKFSRPSRLVAFKLAEFDAYDAQEDDDDDSSLEDQEGEDYDE